MATPHHTTWQAFNSILRAREASQRDDGAAPRLDSRVIAESDADRVSAPGGGVMGWP